MFIKKVNSYNYLGITTDSNLNSHEHIEVLKTKLLKSIVYMKYVFIEQDTFLVKMLFTISSIYL